jgi:hypothetical protein
VKPDAPKFEPKPLSPEAIDVPVAPNWRSASPEDAERFREEALAQRRRFAPFGPRTRRRLLLYVAYGAAGYAAFAWLFLVRPPVLVFAALGAVAGAAVALLRTADFTTGLLLGGTAFAAMSATRHPTIVQFLLTASACLLFGCLGVLIGRGEEMKRFDGEA